MHRYGILDIVLQHQHSSLGIVDFYNRTMFLEFRYKLGNQRLECLE